MRPYAMLMLIGAIGFTGLTGRAQTVAGNTASDIVDEILLNRSLEVAQDTDVIVDRVSLPPDTLLPKRFHPGEMFVYVMAGSVVLSQDGEREIVGRKGELVEVPLRKVYAARTTDEGAQLVIFRVHEAGQPIRVMVE
jgi:quercetin dioxygenase-like cupin family protein